MKKVTDLKPRDVIHCKTEIQFQEIAALMDKSNMRCPELKDWHHSKELTCIQPNGAVGYFGYFARQAYNILPATDFIKAKTEPQFITVELGFSSPKKSNWLLDLIAPLLSMLKGKSAQSNV